ncbi:uracil-DNA glycosylase [Paragemmobacter straminiformis]|uniref:Type-4 uracil-DNA glycosylase n=1 Tax=Paragemmobacter straminiformis TaxID=2045119 RepID=A0A842ICI4_9RHOB|nr:uracil-DNA glycosylase [Gemmobacter straminiformis]MBC2837047.1 uracil-DNA glycosylase [Gemmobacter straminiformis]
MGIEGDIAAEVWEGPESWHAALAALAWQADLGVTEVIGDRPVNAYVLPDKTKAAAATAPVARAEVMPVISAEARAAAEAGQAVAAAKAAAAAAGTVAELRAALEQFEHCELKKGARSLVFADGFPSARVLVLGEAPGREEDIVGKPFVGPAGVLLDRMFAAIGLARDAGERASGLYVTSVLPWRPPAQREPTPDEIAMLRPFVERHIALVDPDVIVAMGNAPCAMLLGAKGVLRLRGHWAEALGKPVRPMVSPAQVLRNPSAKRDAWADLLAIRARLGG